MRWWWLFTNSQPEAEAQQKYSTRSGRLTLSPLHARKDSAAIAAEKDFSAVASAAVEAPSKKLANCLLAVGVLFRKSEEKGEVVQRETVLTLVAT